MSTMSTQVRRTSAALMTALAVFLTSILIALPAHAETLISDQQSAAKGADWLKKQYDAGAFTPKSDTGVFADGIIALSAAQLHRSTIDNMLADLRKPDVGPAWVKAGADGGADRLAKIILTADAAGVADPARFFGKDRDLVKELIALVKGRKVTQAWGGYLTVIALGRLGRLDDLSSADMTYLMGRMIVAQDGGFGFGTNPAKGDADYTGIGISAMNILATKGPAGVKSQAQARLTSAIGWTKNEANRKRDAGDDYYWATYSSANSTGVVASALAEAGENTESPRRSLKRQQAATSSKAAWSKKHMGTTDDVRATTQAIFGVVGKGYATAEFGSLTTKTPTISGTVKVGKKLTAKPGTWSPKPAFSYQWYRSGKKISKATTSTYTLTASDKGKTITVKVTGKKSGYGTVSKTSKKTTTVKAGTFTTKTPTISGTVKVGKKLTAKPGTWSPKPAFSYQWYRSGKKISQATKSTYTLTASDKGKTITVKVTGKKSGYTTASKTSKATKKAK